MEFELDLSIMDWGGDTNLSATEKLIRIKWHKTSIGERRTVKNLIEKAKKAGFTAHVADKDGNPGEPAKPKDLPGLFRKGKGEIVLSTGEGCDPKGFAKALVEEQMDKESVVMMELKDGSWKPIHPGDYDPEKNKKAKVVKTKMVAGG